MKRRTFVKTSTALAALAKTLRGASAAPTPPNVVLIVADDLGYGDLSCYGSQIQTPFIDLLAQEGVQFRQFYSANPVCSPSRASILTGRYGVRSGVAGVLEADDPGGMALNEITIAQMLKTRGYATMCVGKWHLGATAKYMPTARGFDEYYGIPYSNDMTPSVLIHNTTVIETPVNLSTITQRYTSTAVDFINRSAKKPFFLYLPHTMPHVPIAASPAFVGKSGMGLYGDVVQEIDWSVGQLMAALKANGLDQNTLVMFTSDNGPWFQGSPGRLRGRKGDTFEGGVREPFIARFPGRFPARVASAARRVSGVTPRTVDVMATTLDLLPTIAALTQTPMPANPVDGVNILPLLTGEASDVARPLFLYFSGWNLQCARMGSWKLHMTRANVPAFTAEPKDGYLNLRLLSPELYNLDSDPEEADDVSAQNPAVVADIQARVNALIPTLPQGAIEAWQDTQLRPVYGTTPGGWPRPILP